VPRTLRHDFFKTWTPEMAYVLGFFAADGSMLRNGRGAHFVEFTVVDRIVLEHIQQYTNSSHRISTRERGGNTKTAYRLQIGSKEWFTDLSRLGFTQHKSKTLQFPSVPRKYFSDFVRGYFDGDGCVYFGEHYAKDRGKMRFVFTTSFTCGNRTFLEELHASLLQVGLLGGRVAVKGDKSGYELVLSHNDSLALYRLMYHTGKISFPYLPRKREKLERAIQVLGLGKRLRE